MSFRRLAVLLVCCSPLLASCGTTNESGFSAFVADHWPHWAGGMPEDVPPRPGEPGYNHFIAHGETSAPTQPSAAAAPAAGPEPQFVATGSTERTGQPADQTVAKTSRAGRKTAVGPSTAPAASAAAAPSAAPSAQDAAPPQPEDSSVVNGGLY